MFYKYWCSSVYLGVSNGDFTAKPLCGQLYLANIHLFQNTYIFLPQKSEEFRNTNNFSDPEIIVIEGFAVFIIIIISVFSLTSFILGSSKY